MARREHPWADIRAAYEAGESELSLSKRFGVDRKTIRVHRRREEWIPHVTPQLGVREAKAVHERAQAQVIDIATRRAVDQAVQSGLVQAVTEQIAEDLAMQSGIAVKVMQACDQTLDRFLRGEIEPGDKQNIADVLSSIVQGTRAGFNLSREMHGKRAGQPSIGEADGKKITRVEFFARPVRAETA